LTVARTTVLATASLASGLVSCSLLSLAMGRPASFVVFLIGSVLTALLLAQARTLRGAVGRACFLLATEIFLFPAAGVYSNANSPGLQGLDGFARAFQEVALNVNAVVGYGGVLLQPLLVLGALWAFWPRRSSP